MTDLVTNLGIPTPPIVEKTVEALTPDAGISPASGPVLEPIVKSSKSILKEPLFWIVAGAILFLVYRSTKKRQNHVASVEGQNQNGKSNDATTKPIATIEWERAKGPNERKSNIKFPSPNKRTSRRI